MELVSHVIQNTGVDITYSDASGVKTVVVPFKKVGVTGKLRPVLEAELIKLLPPGVQKMFK